MQLTLSEHELMIWTDHLPRLGKIFPAVLFAHKGHEYFKHTPLLLEFENPVPFGSEITLEEDGFFVGNMLHCRITQCEPLTALPLHRPCSLGIWETVAKPQLYQRLRHYGSNMQPIQHLYHCETTSDIIQIWGIWQSSYGTYLGLEACMQSVIAAVFDHRLTTASSLLVTTHNKCSPIITCGEFVVVVQGDTAKGTVFSNCRRPILSAEFKTPRKKK